MKKADLNFSFDNYMMRYRNLFRVKSKKFGEKPDLRISLFTKDILNSTLLLLFFFVLRNPFYALEFLFQVKTPSNTSTSSIFLQHHRIHYALSKNLAGALVFFGLLPFITKP